MEELIKLDGERGLRFVACQLGKLLSTDEGSATDVPEWINKVGHVLVSSQSIDGIWHIKIRKAK